MNDIQKELKAILELNNWFTAHLVSSYQKVDESTKKHIDQLYLEFNRRWKETVKPLMVGAESQSTPRPNFRQRGKRKGRSVQKLWREWIMVLNIIKSH